MVTSGPKMSRLSVISFVKSIPTRWVLNTHTHTKKLAELGRIPLVAYLNYNIRKF